jgi:hypothetical protein
MFPKIFCILGFSLGLLSLTATQAGAQLPERPCNEQTIRDAIRIVYEYPQDDSFSIKNDLAFRVYTTALTEHLQATLKQRLCQFDAPKRTFKITFVFRPFFGQVFGKDKRNFLLSPPPPASPVVLTTQGRRMQTPWVQIAQNDKVFEAIYIFNERQVIFDQAKLANPALPINNDLRPIPASVFTQNYDFFLRDKVIADKSQQDLLWLYQLGDPDTSSHVRVPVWDILLQASTGYAILANFLTDNFLSNSHLQSLSYVDITALPETFNRNSYQLNGVIWDSRTSPHDVVRSRSR